MRDVIFLDRDGVINRDSPHYIKTWDEFAFLPGSLEAICRLYAAGYTLIVITNQSAINRRLTTEAAVAHIHRSMQQAVAEKGGRIHDVLFCPHQPSENCHCRKPKPGLIHRAREKYDIDLSTAAMVGDSAKDILCGRNAGCGTTVLVQTGNGAAAAQALAADAQSPDHVARDLMAAADWLLSPAARPV